MDPELQALQQSIQMLHELMVHMSDPQAVAVISKCLQALAGLQQQMMQAQQQTQGAGNPMAAAIAQRLQGAQQGAPQQAGGGGY